MTQSGLGLQEFLHFIQCCAIIPNETSRMGKEKSRSQDYVYSLVCDDVTTTASSSCEQMLQINVHTTHKIACSHNLIDTSDPPPKKKKYHLLIKIIEQIVKFILLFTLKHSHNH